jgi:peptidyl-prolyl cis-trans isomerase C
MTLRVHAAAAIACAALLTACAPKSPPQATAAKAPANDNLGTSTVAASDGTPVNESIYRYYVQSALKKAPEDLTEQERNTVLDSLVTLQLLAGAAEDKGMPTERTIAVELELQRMQLLARVLVNRYIEEHPATDAEIQAAYKEQLPSLGATQYKARHILVKTEDEAKDVIAQLKKGADFADLAKKKSTDAAASSGGELGWFTAQSTVKPFADAVDKMKVGAYSTEPVQTQFGWHVILLEDRKDDEPPTLDSVRPQITNAVNQKKIEAYVAELRKAGTAPKPGSAPKPESAPKPTP